MQHKSDSNKITTTAHVLKLTALLPGAAPHEGDALAETGKPIRLLKLSDTLAPSNEAETSYLVKFAPAAGTPKEVE